MFSTSPPAIALSAFGFEWGEIAVVFGVAIAAAFGSTAAHRWIAQRTGRMTEPRTHRQTTTLFAIGLGGALASLYFLYDSHPLVSFVAVCACFFTGDMLGHALFGTRHAQGASGNFGDEQG